MREIKEIDYKAVLACVIHEPWMFLNFPSLLEKYPELIRFAVLRLIKKNPAGFFTMGYDKGYPDLEYHAAKTLARKNLVAFFIKGIHKRFPELVIKISRVP